MRPQGCVTDAPAAVHLYWGGQRGGATARAGRGRSTGFTPVWLYTQSRDRTSRAPPRVGPGPRALCAAATEQDLSQAGPLLPSCWGCLDSRLGPGPGDRPELLQSGVPSGHHHLGWSPAPAGAALGSGPRTSVQAETVAVVIRGGTGGKEKELPGRALSRADPRGLTREAPVPCWL